MCSNAHNIRWVDISFFFFDLSTAEMLFILDENLSWRKLTMTCDYVFEVNHDMQHDATVNESYKYNIGTTWWFFTYFLSVLSMRNNTT